MHWPRGHRQLVVKPVDMAFGVGTTLWNLSGHMELTLNRSSEPNGLLRAYWLKCGRFIRYTMQEAAQSPSDWHLSCSNSSILPEVLWDRNLLFKWGTVPLPEGWILSGPSQQREDLPYQELVDQFGDRAAEELWKHIHQQEPWMQYKSIPRLMRTAHLTANTWKSTAYSNVIQHLRRSFARAMHEMNGCIAEQKYRCPA
ncbi:unnamed protein product [Symbiodinium natans]|uniref:Uncharacterized protein n=1 Tax=Symbiodinium natans TaxID=878477 RepID=A0A812IAC3_9DINO|nr:unnamed protein product [Symbiodinium natans]